MDFISFIITSAISAILLVAGCAILHKKNSKTLAEILLVSGILAQILFITILWVNISRPPMRTLGETRIWYTLFLSTIGFFTYKRWGYKWFLVFCVFMALLFNLLNILHPENFDKALMPALQSVWFVPHVLVYIFAYALLAAAMLVAVYGLYRVYNNKNNENEDYFELLKLADNIVYLGFSFLTLGLVFGALWAKEAWGHYWTWDPKETWAFITWLAYLLYIHIRVSRPKNELAAYWMLALSFVFLLIAWMGINYLPSAQNSVHVYSQG